MLRSAFAASVEAGPARGRGNVASKSSPRDNRALRFYSEVLGLERLNYGVWEPGSELTFENLKKAQKRYEDEIVGMIPEGTERILDVGCGTGVLSARLHEAGYRVEGMSPSPAQQAAFREKSAAPFHLARFQDFEVGAPFDCVIMSESAQYIPLDLLFPKAAECLRPGGTLIVWDFFTLPHATGIQAKSGHDIEAFRAAAEGTGFHLLRERDVTEQAAPTMELATDFARRAEIGLALGTERLRERRPMTYRLALWLLRKPIAKVERQRPLIDPQAFRENKRYMSFVFEYRGSPS